VTALLARMLGQQRRLHVVRQGAGMREARRELAHRCRQAVRRLCGEAVPRLNPRGHVSEWSEAGVRPTGMLRSTWPREPPAARWSPYAPRSRLGLGLTHQTEPVKYQPFVGKPRLRPPWLGSNHRLVTTLPRVKKWTPSVPCAWLSPNSEFFQPPKE
jgi:hypothetical protein